jgi:hypothetical protein
MAAITASAACQRTLKHRKAKTLHNIHRHLTCRMEDKAAAMDWLTPATREGAEGSSLDEYSWWRCECSGGCVVRGVRGLDM